jgi:hypothetical protein
LIIVSLFAASCYAPEGAYRVRTEPKDEEKLVVDIVVELLKFTSTLNTAVFATAIALTIKGPQWTKAWGMFESYITVFAIALGAISYYGTYWAYGILLEMIDSKTIDLSSRYMEFPLEVQYYGLVGGALLLGFIFVRILEKR